MKATVAARVIYCVTSIIALPMILAWGILQGVARALKIWWGAMTAPDVEVFLRAEAERRKAK